MRLAFTSHGWADYQHWITTDRAALRRINRLIDDILRDPFEGIGEAEPLRHAFAGAWSRRVSEQHSLVYLVDGNEIVILQCRYHYV